MNTNEDTLRPESIDEFVGQKKLLRRLTTHIEAALTSCAPLDHVLLAGRPGFGKTSLANLIARQLGEPIESLTMPISERTLQLTVAKHVGVLLLDEIHAAPKKLQEALLPLLEFGYVQTRSGYREPAGWLTVVGATTEPHKMEGPLYDRFKIKPAFEDYSDEEMCKIVTGMATKAGVTLSEECATLLGQAAGGTPRNASSLVLAGRALQLTTSRPPTAHEILEFCDVDTTGLTLDHYRYIETLAKLGGTAGLSKIATIMRMGGSQVEEIEMFLFHQGLIHFGGPGVGRELTGAGRQRLTTRNPDPSPEDLNPRLRAVE